MKPKDVVHPLTCPECGKPARCVPSMALYGKDYGGFVYVCSGFPECNTYVGCHKGTKHPLGTMANRETRQLRMKVHAALDPLWKSGRMKRQEAYNMLSDAMRIDVHDCHVGMFNALRCKAALDCIKRIKEGLKCGA